ncbi:MAG: hypothetical protein ACK5WT_11525 [Betaproteobacteria bacterium]
MKELMKATCGKAVVTRLTLDDLVTLARRDGVTGYRLSKLESYAKQDKGGHLLEFRAHLAAQPTIAAWWASGGISLVKKSGQYPAPAEVAEMLTNAIFLFEPAPNFDIIRPIGQRYEGADKTHREFQGKFVADHVATGYGDALKKMRERELRGNPPGVQTFIAVDNELAAFKTAVGKLIHADYFNGVTTWIRRTKGDSRVDCKGHWAFKGRQVQSVLYVLSLPLNMWEFTRGGGGVVAAKGSAFTIAAPALGAGAPATVPRRLVFAVTGDGKLVYHMEAVLAGRATYTAEGMSKRYDAGHFFVDSQRQDRLASILGGGVQLAVHMRFGRP